MFLLKFCEGVVALEFVASESCDWPQRQKAVLCGWHFYQWDVTFQDECVRSELKDIQLVSDVRIVRLVHGWAKPPSFLFIYLSVCFLTHILGQVYLHTPANAEIRRQAREDCERSSPAWATEGGESLFLQGGKKKPSFFSFMQNTSRFWTSDWALSQYDSDSQAVTVSQELPACFYTWLHGQSFQLCGVLGFCWNYSAP